ncbi:DUF1700 domain-containing protein [Bacillus sp. S/N-304-OC-R1]|uniref:DUF1700 domain-containing protein n=1 Tax=Bacillus sp. S/N-304-OC-R1 TaxID=2758034 RepID=UPI001C8EC979|nr:DUF1700 domain-containing protein [Bacillus sp. S/N-304-OC-R1]MBY0123741.1 DUF1700 domain-containing protein [Bacillus sp. S/N-304-OC-R1]
MNKETYLKALNRKLKKLPEDEREAALDYYNEYFDEAGEENIQLVIKKLGSPSHVTSQILADFAVKGLENGDESTKKGISAIWFIILAILASPIALPLLIAVVALIFSLVILCGSFILTFFILVLALSLSGIVSIIGGLSVFAQHWPTALFFIGSGLIVSGIGILLFSPLVSVTKSTSAALAKWIKKLFDKMIKRRKEAI